MDIIKKIRKIKNQALLKFIWTKELLKEEWTYHSFAQEGEDIILLRFFSGQQIGFYVDVGACYPKKFSNTYMFYKMGWKGINIDAMPGSMEAFNKLRPRDINIECGISNQSQILTYYSFNNPLLNGFSESLSRTRKEIKNIRLVSQINLRTSTLSEILNKHLPPNQAIDFMNIDVEGLDYEVLKSNNWQIYHPKIVLVEDDEMITLDTALNSRISALMNENGYVPCFKTPRTSIYIDREKLIFDEFGINLAKAL